MNTVDTIAAPATAVGGAIAVIRISGPEALAVGNRVWHGSAPLSREKARMMCLGRCGGDQVLAVYMPGPRSYTGDDVVELHCHGGALAADQVLQCTLRGGCRMAEPGEFTFRAFVNGKLDLVRAEAVSEVISADSRMALNLAERQLAGALSRVLGSVRDQLATVLAECESHLDFPDEELDWDTDLAASLAGPVEELSKLLAGARDGMVIRQGVRVVISGLPNAGKSSLLNSILGRERAIVTSIPGTTRDTLEEAASLGGIPVRLTDTAGLRNSDDEVERIGIERSRREIASAEVELRVLDASTGDLGGFEAHDRAVAIWNKMDMAGDRKLPELACRTVYVSALTGENMEELHTAFRELVWGREDWSEPDFAVSSRHAAELECVIQALPEAMTLLAEQRWDLAAIPLRSAVEALGRITGEYADPDLLEKIFSRFCIGK